LCLRTGSRGALVYHSNDPWGPIKGREFLDQLSDNKLLKKVSASWS
jgi:hypothetical protein